MCYWERTTSTTFRLGSDLAEGDTSLSGDIQRWGWPPPSWKNPETWRGQSFGKERAKQYHRVHLQSCIFLQGNDLCSLISCNYGRTRAPPLEVDIPNTCYNLPSCTTRVQSIYLFRVFLSAFLTKRFTRVLYSKMDPTRSQSPSSLQ